MDEHISTFLAVTGTEDESIAKQFLEVANNDLELAVTLYMESGQHNTASNQATTGSYDDAELAQRLQNEAYQSHHQDDVREADANVHRHETLVDSGFPSSFHSFNHITRPIDFLGQRQQGIFHQGLDFQNRFESLDDDDEEMEEEYDDDVQIVDSDEDSTNDSHTYINEDEDGDGVGSNRGEGRRRRMRQQRDQELTSTQRRLANLFRPPFDIVSILSLDQAKAQAKQEQKWIFINIQDSTEFNCQAINRDLWSKSNVKQVIRENFVFLQYQQDSFNGESYLNFYGKCDIFPHLAILDPLTGERVYKFKDGVVPNVQVFIDEVDKFLTEFSLNPNSNNPIIQHEAKIDPDSLTEEQQIELAMKQSILDNSGNTIDEPIDLDSDVEEDSSQVDNETSPHVDNEDVFDSIKAIDHPEPESNDQSTRIQVRFPNGKRLVRKIKLNDKVKSIYEWLKYVLIQNNQDYGLEANDKFNLSGSDKTVKLIESLEQTIQETNLKNASILLEKD